MYNWYNGFLLLAWDSSIRIFFHVINFKILSKLHLSQKFKDWHKIFECNSTCSGYIYSFNYPTCFKYLCGDFSFPANSNKFDYLVPVPKLKIVCTNALRIKIMVACTAACALHLHRKRNGEKRKRGYTSEESFYGNGARMLLGENPLVRWVSREQTSRVQGELSMQFSRGYSRYVYEEGGGRGGRGRGGKNCSTRDRKRFANVQSTRGRFAFTRFEAIQFR